MVQHFNIGQKVEVNPFENVKYVILSPNSTLTSPGGLLHDFLNRNACEVSTRKVSGVWTILYNVSLLNFTTLMKWFAPYRGTFSMSHKSTSNGYTSYHTIHFLIEGDIMSCW
jgi:hypothetical protein